MNDACHPVMTVAPSYYLFKADKPHGKTVSGITFRPKIKKRGPSCSAHSVPGGRYGQHQTHGMAIQRLMPLGYDLALSRKSGNVLESNLKQA